MTRKPSSRRRTSAAAAAAVGAAAPVLIDIDPSVAGGFILGRFDIILQGRAISADPIQEIGLMADGAPVACLWYGQTEDADRIPLPDGTIARRRSFQFTVSRPQERAVGACHCRIVARNASGQVHEVPYVLAVDPASPTPVTVRSGPTYHPAANDAAARAPAILPPAILYVERTLLDGEASLQVYGWAVAQTPIISVQAFIGDRQIATAGVTGEREDVAQVYATYPNARISGFTLNARVAGADRAAAAPRLRLLCQDGVAYEAALLVERVTDRHLRPASLVAASPQTPAPASAPLPPLSVRLPPPLRGQSAVPDRPAEPRPLSASDPRREIRTFCDRVSLSGNGTLFVSGWAVSAVGITRIAVFLDGTPVGEAEHGTERLDVGARFPALPGARQSGYRCEAHVGGKPDGPHTIHVVVFNSLGDESTIVAPVVAEPVAAAEARAPTVDRPEFRFQLDAPLLAEGAMVEPVTGRLTIEGWVLARSGVTGVRVYLDDKPLGDAHYGLARQDVGAAFPDWVDALRSGYAFHCPPRSLRDGVHTVRIAVSSRNGKEHDQSFTIAVRKADDKDDLANIRRRMSRAESRIFTDLLGSLGFHPHFHLLLRQPGVLDLPRVWVTLGALAGQAYGDWTARVLCEQADQAEPTRAAIAAFGPDAAFGGRFEVISPDDPTRWDATLVTQEAGAPMLCGMLCPGDELGDDALMELALAAGLHRDADFIYADEARISPASRDREPFFKPNYSPDLLLSTNYIGRPWIASPAVLAATGVTPRSLAENGEYDLVLRCAEHAARVHHVPKLLCQRGGEKIDPATAEMAALRHAATRGGYAATVLPAAVSGTWRLKRAVEAVGKVSIIVPTCAAHGHIETCINTLREKTSYRDYEIIVIDNIPNHLTQWKSWLRDHADKIVEIPDAFNWSRFNNTAADLADGEYLLFLNDDIEIVQADWLDAMLEHAQRPEVAMVGPQLLYPDRKVQHAGMFLGPNGVGRHAFRFNGADEPGYFGLALTQRNVIAVTGACMLLRRDTFNRLGRFDEAHQIINNDMDFCLRAHRAGLFTVFTPYATLIHHELASRAGLKDVYDLSHFNAQWKTLYAAGDPFFSPRLSRHADDYRSDDEPVQAVQAGHPLFEPADIRHILVVKLDHIGDFVTALPSIRRLKQVFPHASITVLAAPGSRAFMALEPAIDTFIEFNFFHARSQLGERTLTQTDFDRLRQMLAPYRFDLAVDLRKHLSTRDVLRHSGAHFLAGFDFQGQFPFLDIALEWDGDKALQRKRGHVVDDLLALVAAIGNACGGDRQVLDPVPPPAPVDSLPQAVRGLFDRLVVAVHPGAGNITKQWPAEHFSAVIDLLIEREDVNVVLVGGPDEAEYTENLLATVLRRDRVVSMAGKTSLIELSRLLSACALYIGNDSGPKHIAAALGVPTLGVHSGVVDAVEWAPLGTRAVALRRNMSCAPCYLANAEDCPRNLACLRLLEPSFVYQTARMLLAGLARPVAAALPLVDTVVALAPAGKSRRKTPQRPQARPRAEQITA
jgi:ADP-heptose:LPS heptosyltransferase/GT2 family glycosyltransferase